MRKLMVLVIGMVFLNGCAEVDESKGKANVALPQKITTSCCELNPFNSIVVSGNAKVKLVNGRDEIAVTGINADKFSCQNRVINQVLYLNGSGDDQPIDAVIKVSASGLRNIAVTGNATVSSRNFKADNLILTAKDYGTINLEGYFNIDKIFQYGGGRINIGWIDSDSLRVEGYGNGPICLGGRVSNLVAKLVKDARLHARYLRTLKANVFTTDSALAEVLVLDTLGAFAVDRSNIYYYKRPKNITVVTKNHGNVLYAGWIR